MAKFEELFELRTNSEVLNRLPAPICVKCDSVLTVGNLSDVQKEWARQGYENPDSIKAKIIWPMLIANKDKTIAEIKTASEEAVQTNVDAAIDEILANLIAPTE